MSWSPGRQQSVEKVIVDVHNCQLLFLFWGQSKPKQVMNYDNNHTSYLLASPLYRTNLCLQNIPTTTINVCRYKRELDSLLWTSTPGGTGLRWIASTPSSWWPCAQELAAVFCSDFFVPLAKLWGSYLLKCSDSKYSIGLQWIRITIYCCNG